MSYKEVMDKEHLVELISNSLIYESKNLESRESSSEIINYLNRLNIDQLRTMSKEFILWVFKNPKYQNSNLNL